MIKKNTHLVHIKLVAEQNALTWSCLFSSKPNKEDIISAIDLDCETTRSEHYEKYGNDGNPGGLRVKLRQFDCIREVFEYWDGESVGVYLCGYIKLATIEIRQGTPIYFNKVADA